MERDGCVSVTKATCALAAAVAWLLLLAGCESDEHRLVRLRSAEAAACRQPLADDSAESERRAVIARLHERNSRKIDPSEIPAEQADLAEGRIAVAYYAAKAKESPAQIAAERDSALSQAAHCELATRAADRFIAGK